MLPADSSPCQPLEITAFLRRALFKGPVYRRLYQLRRQRPDIAFELDQLAAAIKQFADEVEAFSQDAQQRAEPPPPASTP